VSRHPGVNGRDKSIFKKMKKEYNYYVYILASKRNGTLYVGVTNSLLTRSFQHKLKENPKSFTAKYNIDKLVYFENYKYVNDAIAREKQLKNWQRECPATLLLY
jgi:predicted GIY-YIG superfamily endonuclease